MRRIKLILFLFLFCIGIQPALSQGSEAVFEENFENVVGTSDGKTKLDPSQLNHPSGWTFDNVYAGEGNLIIKEGGSITLPEIPELIGNANLFIYANYWRNPDKDYEGIDVSYFEQGVPLSVSISNGKLSSDEINGKLRMYGVDGNSRLKITAPNDIVLRNISIYYSTYGYSEGDYIRFSHEAGPFYDPFDLTLNPWNVQVDYGDSIYNITVYTLDGTVPNRYSQRYHKDDKIHIASTTTVRAALILADGSMCYHVPKTYTLTKRYDINEQPENTYQIEVKPGQLKMQLLDLDPDEVNGLVLTGTMNGEDLKFLADAQGLVGSLAYLDLEKVKLEYDGTVYRTYSPSKGFHEEQKIYNYIFSKENRTEQVPAGFGYKRYDCYRNNLARAFFKNGSLVTVKLPESMTELGENIFDDCKALRGVKLPEGVAHIEGAAFQGCNILEKLNFPAKLTSVGDNAFRSCLSLELDNLPNSLLYVGREAFCDVPLKALKLDRKVEMGAGAFSNTPITEIEMTTPCDSIWEGTFRDCPNLTKITIGEGLKYIGYSAFSNSPVKEANLPSTLRDISSNAFLGYSSYCPFINDIQPENHIRYIGKVAYQCVDRDLEEYTIKDGTVTLADNLFENWQGNATTFHIPASVEQIGNKAFAGTQIKTLPEMLGLKRIGGEAFYGCKNLKKLTIPETVEYIGGRAFYGCSNIWSLTYNAINAECESFMEPNAPLEKIVIGGKVRRLPNVIFSGREFTEVALPSCLERIDDYAFSGCENLTTINLSDSIRYIGDNAFSGCKNLTSINLSDCIRYIGNNVFSECKNLTTINLSDSIRYIGEGAFYGCSSLKNIHWPLRLTTIGNYAFRQTALETISLPEGVTSVGINAFHNCPFAKTVYIPSTANVEDNCSYYFEQEEGVNCVITCMSPIPHPDAKLWNKGVAAIKVPAELVEQYKAQFPDIADKIMAVNQVGAMDKDSKTSFAAGISEEADLGDAVIGDVYVTVGDGDGYDSTDGSIVLNSTMTAAEVAGIGSLAPGKSDIANRFNGLIVKVNAGDGTMVIDCKTVGKNTLNVKVGEAEPQAFVKSDRGTIEVAYRVGKETCVYIYGAEQEMADDAETAKAHQVAACRPLSRAAALSASASENCVKIYAVGVSQSTGINHTLIDSNSPIIGYYTLDGVKIEQPNAPGIYVVRRANGSNYKLVIK